MYFFQESKSKNLYLLLLSFCLVLCCLLAGCSSLASTQSSPTASATQSASTPVSSPTPTTPKLLREDLQRGMIYPQWGTSAYGVTDTVWQKGIKDMQEQTGATWLEIPILLEQATPYSTSVSAGSTAPSLDAFASGIHSAATLGYHIFVVPLLKVDTEGGWAGIVQISGGAQQAWFDSYWNALKPYAEIAQQSGVEQMAIGTEITWMEKNGSASLWNQLISRMKGVFKGILTYDINWYLSLTDQPPSWMKNAALARIGLSEYVPLIDTPTSVDPDKMPALWKDKVGKLIDTFSKRVGKPIILSEIGYRSTADTLYNPFANQSSAATDQQAQAAAYAAALINIFDNPNIVGVFFWGWDDVGKLGIAGKQAVQVVYRWYTKTA